MPSDWVPARRDIVWIDCTPHAGREMKSLHPLLVLSPRPFNAKTGIVIGLPMTTARYNDSNPFAIRMTGPDGKVAYLLAHQPKSFDWRARHAHPHRWKSAPDVVVRSAAAMLSQIIIE